MTSWESRIVGHEKVDPATLKANPLNHRLHPKTQRDVVRDSINEIGFIKSVTVNRLSGLIVDGHERVMQALESQKENPDLLIDVEFVELTPGEEAKALAVLDASSELAEVDPEQITALLDVADFDDGLLKELAESLKPEPELIEDENADADEVDLSEPRMDAMQKIWKVEPGNLYSIQSDKGNHRLLCGSCRESKDVKRLLDGSKINVAFTSPPYASQRKYDEQTEFKPIPSNEYVEWFEAVQENVALHLADDGSWFVNIKEHCEDGQRVLYVKDLTIAHVRQWEWMFVDEFCWTHGGTPKNVQRRFKNGFEPVFQFAINKHKFRPKSVAHAADEFPDWKGLHPSKQIVLDHGIKKALQTKKNKPNHKMRPKNVMIKSDAIPIGDGMRFDTIQGERSVFANATIEPGMAYPSNVISAGKNTQSLGHSAAFPPTLPAFFIKAFSDAQDVIYDPFMGSGSTMVAANDNNRNAYGMEISPKYCAIILQRMVDLGCQVELVQS